MTLTLFIFQFFSRPLIKSSYDYNQLAYKPGSIIEMSTKPSLLLQQHTKQQQQQQQQHIHMQQQHQQQQQQIGRNLSAMLDENNTVICYLEPMSK